MSTASKGASLEREAMTILESLGWTVYRAGKVVMRLRPEPGKPPRMLTKQHDILGAFDLIAVKPDQPILFVQVSVKAAGWDKRAQVKPILPKLPQEHCDAEIWLWVGGRRESGGQRFRVQRWNGLEWVTCGEHEKAKRVA